MRENRMFNVIIFLLGAGIMFFMALRSVLARRRLCTQGQKVTATVEPGWWCLCAGLYYRRLQPSAALPEACAGQELCGGGYRHLIL